MRPFNLVGFKLDWAQFASCVRLRQQSPLAKRFIYLIHIYLVPEIYRHNNTKVIFHFCLIILTLFPSLQEYFSKWGESGTVDLKYELEHLIILTASRCLLGREVREKLFDDVSALFHDLDNGMRPVSVLFPYLPIPAHHKRDRARARLAEIFASIIHSRKASGQPPEQDMLQSFIDSRLLFGAFLFFPCFMWLKSLADHARWNMRLWKCAYGCWYYVNLIAGSKVNAQVHIGGNSKHSFVWSLLLNHYSCLHLFVILIACASYVLDSLFHLILDYYSYLSKSYKLAGCTAHAKISRTRKLNSWATKYDLHMFFFFFEG